MTSWPGKGWAYAEMDAGLSVRDYAIQINTGEITLTFEAIVGHTLDFESNMYLYVNANNDAMVWADFSKTFGFNVTAADGVALQWQTVPEPATMLLLALGGLVLRRKR